MTESLVDRIIFGTGRGKCGSCGDWAVWWERSRVQPTLREGAMCRIIVERCTLKVERSRLGASPRGSTVFHALNAFNVFSSPGCCEARSLTVGCSRCSQQQRWLLFVAESNNSKSGIDRAANVNPPRQRERFDASVATGVERCEDTHPRPDPCPNRRPKPRLSPSPAQHL